MIMNNIVRFVSKNCGRKESTSKELITNMYRAISESYFGIFREGRKTEARREVANSTLVIIRVVRLQQNPISSKGEYKKENKLGP